MKHLSFPSSWQPSFLMAMLLLVGQLLFAQQNTITLVNNQNQWAGIVTAAGMPLSVSTDNGTQPQSTLMINSFQPNGLVGAVHSLIGFPNKDLDVRDVSEAPIACGQGGLYVTGIVRDINAAGASNGNMFVALVQPNGAVCWYFEHANTSTTIKEEGVSVVTMPNGDVIAVGNTNNPQLNATSVIAARFTPTGAMVWSNFYNCSCTAINPPPAPGESTITYTQDCNLLSREACLDLTGGTGVIDPTAGRSGVAVVGSFGNGTAANPNSTMVLDIDGLGNEMWRNTYGYGNPNQISADEGYDIIQDNTPTGNYGFGLAGKAISATGGANYVYFVRLTGTGGIVCNNVINRGTANINNFHARGIQLSNRIGNYILAGPDFVSGNTFAMELGTCGTPIWANTYPLTTTGGGAESISKTATGYFITTNNISTSTGMNQHILMTDFAGLTGVAPNNCPSTPMTLLKLTAQRFISLAKCQVSTPAWSPGQPIGTALPVTENPCPTANPCDPNFHANVLPITICPNACGTLIANAVGGVAPYTFSWSNGAVGASNTVCTAGTYTVTITDANGCTTTATVVVNAGVPPVVTTTNGTIGCSSPCATLSATASGIAPFTYLWSNGAASATTTACAVGIYTITVTDANGCTSTGTAIVQGTPTFNVRITGNGLLTCTSPCTALTATIIGGGGGAFTYNWSNGTTAPTTTVCTAGIYTVTVTDAAGCTGTSTFTVVGATSAPVATITGGPLTCANPCTALTATGSGGVAPYTFNWSTGAIGNMMTTCTAGAYTVTVTDVNGCTSSSSFVLLAPNLPTVAITATGALGCNPNTPQCVTLTATGSGGLSPYNYTWSHGILAPIVTICTPGTYTVTLSDVNGCTATSSFTVAAPVPAAVTATAGTITCTSPCVVVTATASGVSPFTYIWSNGASTPSMTTCIAGVYTVTVTAANGCTATASVTVVSTIVAPQVTITGRINICCGEGTTLTATGGITYLWSNGTTTPVLTIAPGSIPCNTSNIYTVTVTGTNGCTATKSVIVTTSAPPTVTIVRTGNACPYTLTATGGGTYAWSNGAITAATTATATGIYTVTVTNSLGCTATATISVVCCSVIGTATATNITCLNPCATLTATAIGGTAPYTFTWSNGTAGATTTTCAVGVYFVTITDANGCVVTVSVTVTSNMTPPQAVITGRTNICCGEGTTLTATGGGTYLWSNGATTAVMTLLPGTVPCMVSSLYTVTVTGANGCTATRSTAVTTFPPPTATIVKTGTTCPYTLTASGGGTYLWSNGATTAATTATATGTYTVTVTNTTGCTATATISVDCCNLNITELRFIIYMHAQAVTFVTPTVTGCATPSVLSYLWEFGDGTTSILASPPSHSYPVTGVYTACVTVTCTKPDGTFCRVKCCRDVNIGKNCPTLYPTFAYTAPAAGLGVYNFTGSAQSAGLVFNSSYEIFDASNTLVTAIAGSTIPYTFPAAGEYTVCRTITSIADANYGMYCGNKNCRKITVIPATGCNAVAKFIATVYKSNQLLVAFNASSYSTGATTYNWEYGTAPAGPFTPFATGGTPSFTFPAAGVYWVKLILNKGTACETWVIARIQLNAVNCTSSASTINPPTGARTTNPDGSIVVGNSDINDGIALYPNPTEGDVTITLGNDIKATTMIKIYDMKGTLMTSYRTQEGEAQIDFNLANYPSGMYLFNIENESGERLVKKVMKQ
ncbi:MAG: hypothetical protein RI894_2505 [Bacteroidota bacterium]